MSSLLIVKFMLYNNLSQTIVRYISSSIN